MKTQDTQQLPHTGKHGPLLLKVCGMKHNIGEVAALDPDYMGFIFWKGSPRYYEGQIPSLNPRIRKAGVFVDAPMDAILEKAVSYGLDAIQLHGNESPAFCAKLKGNLRANAVLRDTSGDRPNKIPGVIKVFTIKDSFDFSVLEPYEEVCDFYLFDTKGKLPGGNGYSFNWSVLENYPSEKPYFLSGGIGLDSIGKLGEFLRSNPSRFCHAIDVNSAFESEPGLKDTEKLVQFKNSFQARPGE